MKLRTHWKDAKNRALSLSGVEAVKKGFFSTSGIGKALDKAESADAKTRPGAAKAAVKAIDAYLKMIKTKSTREKISKKQLRNVDELMPPLEKMRGLLSSFSSGKINWSQVDSEYAGSDSDHNGMIVSIDPKDKVIAQATSAMSKNNKNATVVADKKLTKSNFENVEVKADIIILAHGTTPIFKSSQGNVHATTFGGKKPDAIVKYLAKTLPKLYCGKVYLDGCFTGAGQIDKTYAGKVYKGLVGAGYEYLQVVGNLGAAATTHDGRELVTPPEVDKYKQDIRAVYKKLKAELGRIEKPYDDARANIDKELAALDQSDPEFKNRQTDLGRKRAKARELKNKDPKFVKLSPRVVQLEKVINTKFDIEGLTGTWGPEKAVPK